MTLFPAALAVEARKTVAARVTIATTVFLAVGLAAIAGGTSAAARSGDEEIIAKLGPAAAIGGWDGLLATVLQVTAAGGTLAFGVVLSWIVGREFADGTVGGLFALPVRRSTIVTAKLAVYLMWTVVTALLLVVVVALTGWALALPAPSNGLMAPLLRLPALAVLSALIVLPAAWAATVGRGILPGIGTTVGIMATAQIMAVAGVGAWFPVTAPALWALDPGVVSPAQLAFVATVPLLFGWLTIRAWSHLQLDR
jgi:ABC-2 type transport system permease protein